jgi:hypothetical protein
LPNYGGISTIENTMKWQGENLEMGLDARKIKR